LRHLLPRQGPDCSAENRSSIAGLRADPRVRDSASLADQPRLALTRADHGPNIPHGPGRADLQAPEALQHPAHGQALAHALDLERGQVSLEHALVRAAHLRPVKLLARSAQVRVAVDVASSSIPRLKKAR
jgi:hypothetical protein